MPPEGEQEETTTLGLSRNLVSRLLGIRKLLDTNFAGVCAEEGQPVRGFPNVIEEINEELHKAILITGEIAGTLERDVIAKLK